MTSPKNKINKEIFIASVGITPQIITEALHFYFTSKNPRKFDQIFLVTTNPGAKKIRETLFEGKQLYSLEKKLGIKHGSIKLSEKDIFVIKDKDGKLIEDIRNNDEIELEMVQLFDLFKDISQDTNVRITATVAGGRKSMSVAMGLAMQLYGREFDELVHIMVPEHRFNDPNWFFPETKDESVEVYKIPYLRINEHVRGVKETDPRTLLKIAQTRLSEKLLVNIDLNKIIINKHRIKLSPKVMGLWRYLAKKKIDGVEMVDHEMMTCEYSNIVKEQLACLNQDSARYENAEDELEKILNIKNSGKRVFEISERIRWAKTTLKSELKKKSPFEDLPYLLPVEIDDPDDRRKNIIGLSLNKDQINFID